MEERFFNVNLFFLHIDMLIIFKKLILINEYKFIFTNIEVVQTTTSMIKSSMEVLLFQWGQVFKNPEWKSMIDAWFGRFKVSINLNIFYYVNSVSLLILIIFYYFITDFIHEFKTILNQQVEARTTHLATQIERFTTEVADLRQLYMKLKSHVGGACALPYWPHGPSKDHPPPPPTPLF